MRENVDTTGNSLDAAGQFVSLMRVVQGSPLRQELPPDSLHLGTRRKKSLGEVALELSQQEGKIRRLHSGDSRRLYDQITRGRSRIYRCIREGIGLLSMSYVLHNFPSEESGVFLQRAHEHCPNALCVVADYTLEGLAFEEALPLLQSDAERAQMARRRSPEAFVEEHQKFTLGKLQDLVMEAGWKSTIAVPLKAGRATVIGTGFSVRSTEVALLARDVQRAVHLPIR